MLKTDPIHSWDTSADYLETIRVGNHTVRSLPKASHLKLSPSGPGLQEIHLVFKVPSPLSSSHLVSREPTCSAIDGGAVYSQYHLPRKGEISSYGLLPLDFIDMGQMSVLIFLKFPHPNDKAFEWIT